MATGRHVPPSDDVAKTLPAGASVNAQGTALIQAVANLPVDTAGGQPAMGVRPSPGPLPPTTQPVLDPFRYQFQWSTNLVWTPRQDRIGYAVLRTFAELCDVVRTCIQVRKDQMCSLEWELSWRDGVKTDEGALDRALKFFQDPDGSGSGFEVWFRSAMEEVLVCDNLTLYRHPTRGGQFGTLDVIDGDTIKVLVDDFGRIPNPPNKAYRQIIYGAPTLGGDYSKDELYYLPKEARTKTPYGLSPIESILVTILTILNRQAFDAQYYTEGNTPPGILETAAASTPDQLSALQKYLDLTLGGNSGTRQRIKLVPKDSKYTAIKPNDFNAPYYDLLVKIVCAAMAVPPSEIGWTNEVNKATGKQQENIVYRRGIKPLAAFFKTIFDRVLAQDLQIPGLEFVFTGGEPEDKLAQAQVDKIRVSMGQISVDDLNRRDGLDPVGLPAYVLTAQGPMLVRTITTPADALAAGMPNDENEEPVLDQAASSDETVTGAPADVGEAVPQTAQVKQAQAELRTWRASAIKAIKRGRLDRRTFETTAVPAPVAAMVAAGLTKVTSVADVVTLFARADRALVSKASPKLRQQREAQLDRVMAGYFRDLKTAVLQHVESRVS